MGTQDNIFADPYSEGSYQNLIEDIQKRPVAAFAGSGMSRAEGVAGWSKVTESFAKGLTRYGLIEEGDVEGLLAGPYDIAELYKSKRGTRRFRDDLKSALHIPRVEPKELEIHGKLLRAPFSLIVTTNFDDLFERASEYYCYCRIRPVETDGDFVRQYGTQAPFLIKAHGDIGNEPVACLEDVYTVERKNPLLFRFLETLFFEQPILFIGYSLMDPDFLHYFFKYKNTENCHYMVTIGESPLRVELLKGWGLRVINLRLGNIASAEGQEKRKAFRGAYLRFVDRLLADTVLYATDQVTRAKTIAKRLKSLKRDMTELRVRAGLSAIGTPTPERWINQRDISLRNSRGEEIQIHPPWTEKQYEAQLALREALSECLQQAVADEKPAKLILATDFQTLQQRAADARWAAYCLDTLVGFFQGEIGGSEFIKVVDRDGPYEIQQHVICTVDGGEIIESRKLVAPESVYYEARAEKSIDLVEDNIRVFDSCYQTFQLSTLDKLANDTDNAGLKYLIEQTEGLSEQDAFLNEPETRIQARAVAKIMVGMGLETKEGDTEGLIAGKESRLFDQARNLIGAIKHAKDEEEKKHLLSCQAAHLLLLTFREEHITQAIKHHLIQKWELERDQLSGERSQHLRIQISGPNGELIGALDKERYHTSLRLEAEEGKTQDYPMCNTHVSAFALSGDANRLILRRCLDQTAQTPHFDPGKWDRTVAGHVRFGTGYGRELSEEILHHFRGSKWSINSSDFYEFASLDVFQGECVDRHRSGMSRTNDRMLVVRLGDVRYGLYRRLRWDRKTTDHTDVEYTTILEPVLSMPYLCLLPSAIKDLSDLPSPDDHDHYSGWVALTYDEVKKLLESIRDYYENGCRDDWFTLSLNPQHKRLSIPKSGLPDGMVNQLTWEAVRLLHMYGEEIEECMKA